MTGRTGFVVGIAAVAILASCSGGALDTDLRGWGPGGFDTAGAARQAAPRPAPDARGIISYPDYQVAVARQGDSVATIAARLGFGAAELASYNAIDPATPLESGSVVALPRRVATASTSGGAVRDPFAGQAATAGEDGPAQRSAPAPAVASGPQPAQHVVAAGETAWSIARKYGIGVADLAAWNGLNDSMTIRVGQRLLIPKPGAAAPKSSAAQPTSAPGKGSPTPTPPSASAPLPAEKTRPAADPASTPDAPDLGANRTAASGSGSFAMPVQGSIIRPYEKGKNEGIDISAAAGSPVKAAGAGTVAAITRDANGIPIVVVRHGGDLMTVYTGLDSLTVTKGEAVKAGQAIGKVAPAGVLHFEVRRGFESSDPEKYL